MLKLYLIYRLVFFALNLHLVLTDEVQITIADGKLIGTQQCSGAGTLYNAFYSIPYAKPPIGKLRFQAPVPVDPWNDIYDATNEKNICYQVAFDAIGEDEDCLTLNVFTPVLNLTQDLTESLPVMLYFHGGGFVSGSGQTRSGVQPGYFMDSNVIIIAVNYRLGPFGFISTGDTVIPGNAGLKDQVLAMKWAKKNAAYFGGNTTNIVIFGESAGGASVGYHILSPQSAGLFTAGIIESATALSPPNFQRNQTEITYQTATFINPEFYSQRDSQKLLDFLQSVDAKTIDDASRNYTIWATSYNDTGYFGIANAQMQQGFFYGPVVEVEHDTAFLTDKPYNIMYNGNINKVPLLIGTCAEEGLVNLFDNLTGALSVYDEYPQYLVPKGFNIVDEVILVHVGELIKNEYSPNSTMKDNLLSGIQYYTDHDFQKSLIKHAEFQALYADVFFYNFTYSGEMGGNVYNRFPGSLNVTHGEELSYIFETNNPNDFPEQDQIVHERLVKFWVNFATYHNPTPISDPLLQNITWPKYNNSTRIYIDIGADLSLGMYPKHEKYDFWNNLLEEFGVGPFDTF